jgi:hypothetical protein
LVKPPNRKHPKKSEATKDFFHRRKHPKEKKPPSPRKPYPCRAAASLIILNPCHRNFIGGPSSPRKGVLKPLALY